MRIACIGSREISPGVRRALWNTGRLLAIAGHDVVSGNARGADQAFGGGVNHVDRGKLRLCLPWAGYEQKAIRKGNKVMVAWEDRHAKTAAKHHPCWSDLGGSVQQLMARNVAIIAGAELVIAYPSLRKPWGGGTGFGILLARAAGKPVVDLARADGLDHFLHALESLPWPESQDMVLELVWLQRLGGRLDREAYEDRMLAVGSVLLADLSEKPSEELALAIERLPASLIWRMLDGQDLASFPSCDEEGCIDWRAAFGRLREDPIRDRVLLPYASPRRKPVVADEDPDSPESELRRIFQVHDTGNPVWDREAALAMVHDGERRWIESSVAMPSGMVMQRSDTPPRWRDPFLHHLKEASWDFFRARLGQEELPATRDGALEQKGQPAIEAADYLLLARLREGLGQLDLDTRHKVALLREIRDDVGHRARGVAVHRDPVLNRAAAARVVLQEWSDRLSVLAAAVGTDVLEDAPVDGVIDWSIVEFRLRDRYPMAHVAWIRFAMEQARRTWAAWQDAEAAAIDLADSDDEDDDDGEIAADDKAAAGCSESFLTGVGHLYRPVLEWEAWQPRKVRELLDSIRAATRRSELVLLAIEVECYTREARRVLDEALGFARERVRRLQATRRARLAREIGASCSVRRLDALRVRLAGHSKLADLRGAIDARIAALKTLRSGRLTEGLKLKVLWERSGSEGGTFAAPRFREAIRRQLGGRPKPELLDKLLEEARILWEIGSRAGDVERAPALSR
ncbi:MAG: hypothetical protein U0166_00625 [Acidobacteriota bacterium]